MTLTEALQSVELEPGRTYRCQVRGRTVEVRVVNEPVNGGNPPSQERLLTKELCEEDIMLDAWCELPEPKWTKTFKAQPGPRHMPDIPEIPRDEEDSE